jgi:soluble lytic murein transglycosylase-like protein
MRLRAFAGPGAVALLLFTILSAAAQTPPARKSPAHPEAAGSSFEQSLKLQRASLQQQRKSLAAQSGISSSDDFIPPLPAFVQADCDPLPASQIDELIDAAARQESLDPALLRAVMRQESGFRPCAVSNKGALGLMQLMPATASELRLANPLDPDQNVRAGAKFLKTLLARYHGDLRLALVAYNAGALRASGSPSGPYPAETQSYLAHIFAELDNRASGNSDDTPDPLESDGAAIPPQPASSPGSAGNNPKTHSQSPEPAPPAKTQAGQITGSPQPAQ